jgi:hypothetical protein
MTVQDLYQYIKHTPFVLVETGGTIIPSYDRHKYMYREIDELSVNTDILFIYLSNE